MGKSIKNLSSVTVVGLDIAKNVFQVHAVDAQRGLVVAKPVRRGQLLNFFASLPRCLVGIEACSSAHHWSTGLRVYADTPVFTELLKQINEGALLGKDGRVTVNLTYLRR